jgi:hypothetical protein
MIPRTIALSVALAAVAAVPALWAADTSAASKPTTPAAEAAGTAATVTPRLLTVDFPGGTVAELTTAIGVASGNKASVFILNPNGISINGANASNGTDAYMAAVVPPFSVRNVTPENLARAFNEAMAPSGLRLIANGSSFLVMQTKLPGQSSEPAASVPGPTRPVTPSAPPINFDFSGGTVGDLIGALHKNNTDFNLIAEPPYLKLTVPSFSIRNTDAFAFGSALERLLRTQNVLLMQNGGPSGTPIWVILPQPSAQPSKTPENVIQSFQLGPYLERYQVDDIVSAIRTAWTLDPANSPDALQLKFHPATRLLLVAGPGKAISVAFGVLGALETKHESKPAPAPALPPGSTPAAPPKPGS